MLMAYPTGTDLGSEEEEDEIELENLCETYEEIVDRHELLFDEEEINNKTLLDNLNFTMRLTQINCEERHLNQSGRMEEINGRSMQIRCTQKYSNHTLIIRDNSGEDIKRITYSIESGCEAEEVIDKTEFKKICDTNTYSQIVDCDNLLCDENAINRRTSLDNLKLPMKLNQIKCERPGRMCKQKYSDHTLFIRDNSGEEIKKITYRDIASGCEAKIV